MNDYTDFIASRRPRIYAAGIEPPADLCPALMPHQRDSLEFALRVGRSALFLDTGLGKSLCSLEWARIVAGHTGKPVLILTPLAVAPQFVREGQKFGVEARHIREGHEVGPGINIANYERLSHFDAIAFGGVVLDESSILKAFNGKTRLALTDRFSETPFRLCCTATPAPNDHMELGNHSEFLGVMTGQDMLQRWFINDTAEASQEWRLKGHAVADFWDWVCSWARCLSSPADLGYNAEAYILPELREVSHQVDSDLTANAGAALFRLSGISATNMHAEQRLSLAARVDRVAWLVAAEPSEPFLIWCETDQQADALHKAIPHAVEVRGSHPAEWKEQKLNDFSEGNARILITKARIAGHGLNWQHCARMAFLSLSFSYEAYYQAVRRCWRFGQTRPVVVHRITSDGEAAIFGAVRRKAEQHDTMKVEMLSAVRRAQGRESIIRRAYEATHRAEVPAWVRTAA
jgi:hypothetical protein